MGKINPTLSAPFIDSCLLCRHWLWTPGYYCESCKRIIEGFPLHCRNDRGLDIFSLCHFVPPMDKLVRLGKNIRANELFKEMAEIASRKLALECLWPVVGVVPMPPKILGTKDHAYVIGETSANFFKAPLCPQFLKRTTTLVNQKDRSQKERHEIKLEATSNFIKELEIDGLLLLVDDVVTSGATLHQAWSLLGKVPAVGLTLASTPLWSAQL